MTDAPVNWYPLEDVLDIINNPEWSWNRNSACKYVNINVDTREASGKYHPGPKEGVHCQIRDVNENPLTIEQLGYQHTSTGSIVIKPRE